MPGPVADREALALQLEAARRPSRWKPSSRRRMRSHRSLVTRADRASAARAGAFDPALEVLPDLQQVEPGPGGLPPYRLAALEAVGLRPGAGHLRVAGGHAAEQVGGEQAADDLQRS